MTEQSAKPRPTWDLLLRNAQLATMDGDEYGLVGRGRSGGALAVQDGRIAWLGETPDLPAQASAREEIDCNGALLTPGLIDCHTHLVHGGNRADEFERRLEGASYEEIARAGGGIRSTVRATRALDADGLVAASRTRLHELVAEGVTTVEIKSGYGLDLRSERAMLQAAGRLGEVCDVSVARTFLGAHALPEEFAEQPDAYIDHLIAEVMPALAREGLVDAVDAFCETIGFTPTQVDRLFGAARELGLPVKLHAEQLSDQGGAKLVARHGGLSADHLEWLSPAGVTAMAEAGTVAVLLPGAFYFLRETRQPPLEELRRARVPMAIATDCNPGSSPVTSPLLMLNMACVLFRLTPNEALAGMTRVAARALGFSDRGVLREGLRADLALWSCERPGDLCYGIGSRPLLRRWHSNARIEEGSAESQTS